MKILNIEKLHNSIDKRVSADISAGKVGGCSLLVNQDGKDLYRKDFSSPAIPDVNKNTLFRLASMTKPITAAAIFLLAQEGKLDLEDKAEKYCDGFSEMYIGRMTENRVEKDRIASHKITIHSLLTHTSGLVSGNIGSYFEKLRPQSAYESLEGAVKYYSGIMLDFDPDSAQEYSGIAGFDVLAYIVQKISGKDYNDFLGDNLFAKLEMENTTFTPSQEQWERLIPMHSFDGEKSFTVTRKDGCVFESFPTSYRLGGAGLVSNISDYSHFASMLLNGGCYKGRKIIDSKYISYLSQSQIPKGYLPYPGVSWSYGVRVITDDKYPFLDAGSFGWSGAYGTHFWIDIQNKVYAIYLKNSLYDGGAGAVTSLNFEEDVHTSFEK